MRIVLVGAGATGSLFAARFARAGEAVVLVGRPDQVAMIRARGVRIEGAGADTVALEAVTELPAGTAADATLLTVKSFDLSSAAGIVGRGLAPSPLGLPGNGLGIEDGVERTLRAAGWAHPERFVVRAVHTVPATYLGPGRVRATGAGELVFPAGSPAGLAEMATERLVELFRRAGFAVHRSPEFERELWRKAVVNAAVNPVTALRGVPNGALAHGPHRTEALALLREAVEVATANGVNVSWESSLEDFDRVVRATAENRSSMLQDVERGRPTEVDAISGEILRRGERYGLSLPETARVLAALRDRAGRSPAAKP